MAHYKQPRKFNWVSVPFYAALIGLVYCGIKFGPPYWRNMKVDEVVRSTVNEYWSLTRGSSSYDAPPELRDRFEKRLRDLGVDDPKAEFIFERDGEDLRVTARYHVVVPHWFTSRTTSMRFAPTAATPIVDKRM
ncbi:MAG: hypothetical protein HY906_28140 [Deltaproteobacteria bacterium]|nr:hypothetical protein [Deltaproteobacteria bacterium]